MFEPKMMELFWHFGLCTKRSPRLNVGFKHLGVVIHLSVILKLPIILF